jgi:hypothetical protein
MATWSSLATVISRAQAPGAAARYMMAMSLVGHLRIIVAPISAKPKIDWRAPQDEEQA